MNLKEYQKELLDVLRLTGKGPIEKCVATDWLLRKHAKAVADHRTEDLLGWMVAILTIHASTIDYDLDELLINSLARLKEITPNNDLVRMEIEDENESI